MPEDSFGARVALVRQKQGWNVSEAAQACNTKPSTWAGWEAGAMPRNLDQVCRKISAGSGASYRYLMLGGPLVNIAHSFFDGLSSPSEQGVLLDDACRPLDFAYPHLASVTDLASRRAS